MLGQSSAHVARDGHGGLEWTVMPLPTYPRQGRTLQDRKQAVCGTYAGRLEEAVDLYRATVEEDGYFTGILNTVAHGLLGLPQQFQGDPTMVAALTDSAGTPGDDARMHPAEECSKIFSDGVGFGLGLGQYLLTCWRCGGVDLVRIPRNGGGTWEVCRRCDAERTARHPGQREIFALQWRDPRWLFRNTVTLEWKYIGRGGMVPMNPGDGEWFLFRTVPDVDAWRHGPWVWASIAAIFRRDARFDRQNTSAVSAPTPTMRATGPTTKEARRDMLEELRRLAHDNRILLPAPWIYEIIQASGEYHDVAEGIIEDAVGEFEVGITGNRMGIRSEAAFSNTSVYHRVTASRRAYYAGVWARAKHQQGLVWWARDNFGTSVAPVPFYDTRSPEDINAEAKAFGEWGDGFTKLEAGAASLGVEIDPAWAVEMLQRHGVRARVKAQAPIAAPVPVAPQRPRRKAKR